jgi:hypothetical protein
MFKRAAAVAATVPPPLQEAAFNRALDALMSPPNSDRGLGDAAARKRHNGASGTRQRPGSGAAELGDNSVASLLAIPRSTAEQVDDEEGALGKSLALLRVAEEKLKIGGLSASQIAQVLTTKFKWKAVNQALDRSGKMVDSSTIGGARSYTIMDAGIRYLDTPPDQRQASSGATRRRSRPVNLTPSKSTTRASEDTASPAKKPPRRPGGGPSEAVERLVSKGYFNEPRLLGAIREELRDARGLVYKSSDLSPVMTRMLREGKLGRSKNQDGQYEYVSS